MPTAQTEGFIEAISPTMPLAKAGPDRQDSPVAMILRRLNPIGCSLVGVLQTRAPDELWDRRPGIQAAGEVRPGGQAARCRAPVPNFPTQC